MNIRVACLACMVAPLISCGTHSNDDGREASDDVATNEADLTSLNRSSSLAEALRLLPVKVGDKVRVVPTEVADELGISGLTGEVIDVSPSASGNTDHAGATVFFEGLGQEFGMSSSMLELVDLPVGTDISMGDRTWVRTENGEWEEISNDR